MVMATWSHSRSFRSERLPPSPARGVPLGPRNDLGPYRGRGLMLPRGDPRQGDGNLEPFEVFRQEREGEPMRHGGSVVAPDPTLALHYARELYARRAESLRLWVVRRADI